jgi:hypothetical protein
MTFQVKLKKDNSKIVVKQPINIEKKKNSTPERANDNRIK